jgi:hypothetical protein
MISFDLSCGGGHRFEGWFSSSVDYEDQQSAGLLTCPVCDDANVNKMLSAPNIGRKGNQPLRSSGPSVVGAADAPSADGQMTNAPILPPAMVEVMQKMATLQSEMLKDSKWVGRQFAETARAIHYGESEDRLIHGEASPQEAEALAEEGVSVAPLPFPFIPPEAKN